MRSATSAAGLRHCNSSNRPTTSRCRIHYFHFAVSQVAVVKLSLIVAYKPFLGFAVVP
jgi:hypothetical protein